MKFLVILMMISSFALRAESLFTEEEQQWIQENPVVWYTYPERWPTDFHRNGKHIGLSKDYLNALGKITGLDFQEVRKSSEGVPLTPVDLMSAVSQRFQSADQDWLTTLPFLMVSALVITQADQQTVYSLRQLYERRVGIMKDSLYAQWLSEYHPQIKLIRYDNALQALTALERGELYAVLGTEVTFRPILRHYFPAKLSIAGVLSETYTGVSMLVNPSKPPLVQILNKALESLTAKQTDEIFSKWVASLELGAPPVTSVFYYYRNESVILGISIILLVFALYQTRKARIRAEISEQDKARFLAVMSHEIRTPLNAVIASLELLQQPGKQNREAQYISMARNSAHNLMELLNDILDFSRLESDQMTLHKGVTPVKELLTSVHTSHLPSAVNKGLSLVLEDSVPCDNICIYTDSQRIRQILHNVVANAIKFSSHGEVRMRVEALHQPDDELMLRIHVSDQGPGIEQKAQTKLFEAWQQASRSEAKRSGGSGLGLYISYQLARMLGGDLSLRSELGKGTCVTLSIPMELLEGDATEQTAELQKSALCFDANTSVLVVEDHELNQALLREQLEQLGCHVETASSCKEVEQLLEDENYYSLILLDCHLPDGTGYELAEQIRKYEQLKQNDRTPIVAISAMSEQEHIQRCHSSGMDDVLFKPIRIQNLVDILTQWCSSNVHTTKTEVSTSTLLEPSVYLETDLKALELAFNNKDTKHQLYYAHRIHGVAKISGHNDLIVLVNELENLLRSGVALSVDEGIVWCQKLKSQIDQSA